MPDFFLVARLTATTKAAAALALAIALVGTGPGLAGPAESTTSRFSPTTTTLPLKNAESYGVYAWSPDSKTIAMSATLQGGLVVIDISTGAEHTVALPPFSPRAIAWSRDQSEVVVTSEAGFVVIRVSDLSVAKSVNWTKTAPTFFGWSVAFTPDGSKLLFDNDDIGKTGYLLYSYDLRTGAYDAILRSPLVGQRLAAVDTDNRLQYISGRLFYVPLLRRYDEELLPTGSDNRMMATEPSSCIAYEIEGAASVGPPTQKDFPPDPKSDSFDGAKDIQNCQYLPSGGLFEVARVVPPYHLDAQGVPVHDGSNAYFEAADAASDRLSGRFGPNPSELGDLAPNVCATTPSRGLAATISSNANAKKVVVWDVRSGSLVGDIEVPVTDSPTPQFSPDGRHLSILRRDEISVLTF